ncbi:MAG: hypothetical protein PHE84_10135 [bacterium]|nr:hypothetical protein [bacterium]
MFNNKPTAKHFYSAIFFLIIITFYSPVCPANENSNYRKFTKSIKVSDNSDLNKSKKPEQVNIHIKINDIWNLDYQMGTFEANLYVFLEWQGDLIPKIEFMNGQVEKDGDLDTFGCGRGITCSMQRYNGVFHSMLNFEKFPLDKQHLKIIIEPTEDTDHVTLYTIRNQSGLYNAPDIRGWEPLPEVPCQVSPREYDEINSKGNQEKFFYSRYSCEVTIERDSGLKFFIKSSLTLLISLLIVFIGFILSPGNMDSRFGIVLASLFGILGSQLIYQSKLPEIIQFTLIEKLHLNSLIIVLLVMIIFGISGRIYERKGEHCSRMFEYKSIVIVLVIFIILDVISFMS